MMDIVDKQSWISAWRLPTLSAALTNEFRAAAPPLLFGVRLWASVCLAMFIAFWLQLDNPFWAGTSAAIVCQPQLGPSLRKGWFRMIGRTPALAIPMQISLARQTASMKTSELALDPMIDQTLGESSHVRYHSLTLQTAVHGLFMALDGWRGVATHLSRLPEDMARQQTEIILRSIPPELRSARKPGSPARWMADPMALRRVCEEAMRTLLGPAGRHPIAAAARRRDRQSAVRHAARARRARVARRCS